jgi:hypothetical protein
MLIEPLQLVERLLRHEASQPIILIRPELRLLLHRRRILALLLHLAEIILLVLEVRKIVHGARILRINAVDLRQVPLRNDRVVDVRQHLSRVGVQRFASLVVHDALVELARLVVFGEFAFVVVVALARDDVVGDFVGGFGGVGAEFVREGVGGVLFAAGVVGVEAHGAIDVYGAEAAGHEGAVDWDLVEVDSDAVVLGLEVNS